MMPCYNSIVFRDLSLRRVNYGNETHVNISIHVMEDNRNDFMVVNFVICFSLGSPNFICVKGTVVRIFFKLAKK
jgi:hypothetical protein